jgi:phage-related protein
MWREVTEEIVRMSELTYNVGLRAGAGKPLLWLRGEVKTPPFSKDARIEAGVRLRQLQLGATLSLPQSRPMPVIGPRCHELRINDNEMTWRIIYRVDSDAIVILEVFNKRTPRTPVRVIQDCKRRLHEYDALS